MRAKIIGTILVIIGLILIIYNGFTYVTTEKVVDLGSIKINKEENHPIQWSPVVGGLLLVGGVLLIITTKKGKS